jgi:ribosomal protein S25
MDKELFITAEEVAKELRVSKSYAYKVIRQMNQQLKQSGFIVMCGKVSRQYFYEKVYGGASTEEKREVS